MLNSKNNTVHFFDHLGAGINTLARHRLLSIVVVFFLSFGGSWFLSAFRGIPVPCIHDEFSYLLAGDTFAHGRITNPTHPLWEYFETFHVLQKPSCMSIYPPGQGIFLAIGQKFLGLPIYGVWLSAGLMCAAICWMLYAWVSPCWALVGGLVAVLQFGVFTYWSQSYWGGAAAGFGGALVFGALPRVFKYQRLRDALLLGLGIAILANTRPLEGILFGLPLGFLLLPWSIKWQGVDKRRLFKNAVLPVALLVLATALWMGAYNKKITGHARELPHILYSKLYTTVPVCLWQPLYPPVPINHKVIADWVKNHAVKYYLFKKSWDNFLQIIYRDSKRMFMFYFGFPLALPALALMTQLFYRRKSAIRFFTALGIFLFMLGMLTCPAKSHYYASLTCAAVLWITIGLKGLSGLSFHRKKVGTAIIVFLMGLQLLLNILLPPAEPATQSVARGIAPSQFHWPTSFTREELISVLKQGGGKYLVIVKYFLNHKGDWEWVYNDADIDHAPIVWARNMGQGHNEKLLEYFKGRQVLYIEVIKDTQWLVSYQER